MSDATTPDHAHDTDATTPSRRAALRLLGAAAAGAAAAAVAGSGRADAANGDPLVLGSVANVATLPTGTAMSSGTLQNYGLGVTDNGLVIPTPSNGPQNAAILGHAANTAFKVGVGAYAVGEATRAIEASAVGTQASALRAASDGADSITIRALNDGGSGVINAQHFGPSGTCVSAYSQFGNGVASFSVNGTGVFGSGRLGGEFFGNDAAIRLAPTGTPTTRPGLQEAGRLAIDGDGNLWISVSTGSPATWRKLAGPNTAGAFHPITPTRVYDSRQALPGPAQPLASGQSRTVSVRDGRALTGGAVTVTDLVPAGATAIAVNVGIVSIAGPGNLVVNPGGVTTVTSSSINWTAGGQILANGIIATISASREVTLVVGGRGTTHVFLDVTGYFR